MAHIFIAVSTGISVLVTLVLFKRRLLPELPVSLVIFSSLMIMAGAGMIYIHENEIENDLVEKSWPKTEGIIIGSEVAGKRAFHPEITCEYAVDGKRYELKTDLGTPGFGTKRSRQDTAERILAEYPIGKAVMVTYDPAQPSQAFLRVGPSWQAFLKLSLGIIILVTGLIGFTGNILMRFLKTN